ncbi:MAG: hypothetical protein ACOYOH_23210 [Paracraurococcus sp.]|jgi:hypothetical protein
MSDEVAQWDTLKRAMAALEERVTATSRLAEGTVVSLLETAIAVRSALNLLEEFDRQPRGLLDVRPTDEARRHLEHAWDNLDKVVKAYSDAG